MSEAHVFYCRGQGRASAQRFIAEAPEGWKVEVKPPPRNSDINAALHAKLTEVAKTCLWYGQRMDVLTWKRLFTAAWLRATGEQVEVVPALDGRGVDVVYERTSTMTQAQVRDLLTYIEAWLADAPPQLQVLETADVSG